MDNDLLVRAAALRHAAESPATDATLCLLMIETAADMEAEAATLEVERSAATLIGDDPGILGQFSADPHGDDAAS